jgi:hypothetical protein
MPDSAAVDTLMGDPALREQALAHEVKGNLVATRNRWVQTHFGPQVLEQTAEMLEGDAKRWLLQPPLALTWCPMEALVRIDAAVLAGPMEGDVSRFRPFGEEIADYDLSTLYKMLFRLGTPAFILRNLGTAYKAYIRPGVTRTDILERGSARIALPDAVLPRYFCEHGISGWVAAAVKKSGGEDVSVEHTTCRHRGSGECSWAVSWE